MTPGAEQRIKALGGEGILKEKDLEDFTEAKRLLLAAFRTGKSLSVQDMRAITGQDSADRRVRELRAEGFAILREYQGGRTWTYRLVERQGVLL